MMTASASPHARETSPARAWHEALGAPLFHLAVLAVGVEFLLLRILTRIGEFLPGGAGSDAMSLALVVGTVALNCAALAALATVSLTAIRLFPWRGWRGWTSAALLLAALTSAIGSVPGVPWAESLRVPLVGAAIGATLVALPQVRTVAPMRIGLAAFALALVAPAIAEPAWAFGGLIIGSEVLAIAAALTAPVILVRRPTRGDWLIAVGAALLVGAMLAGRPTTAATTAMWSVSLKMWLPAPLYAAASGTVALAVASGRQVAASRDLALALVLLALAGLRPEATYPVILALAAGSRILALSGETIADRADAAVAPAEQPKGAVASG